MNKYENTYIRDQVYKYTNTHKYTAKARRAKMRAGGRRALRCTRPRLLLCLLLAGSSVGRGGGGRLGRLFISASSSRYGDGRQPPSRRARAGRRPRHPRAGQDRRLRRRRDAILRPRAKANDGRAPGGRPGGGGDASGGCDVPRARLREPSGGWGWAPGRRGGGGGPVLHAARASGGRELAEADAEPGVVAAVAAAGRIRGSLFCDGRGGRGGRGKGG